MPAQGGRPSVALTQHPPATNDGEVAHEFGLVESVAESSFKTLQLELLDEHRWHNRRSSPW